MQTLLHSTPDTFEDNAKTLNDAGVSKENVYLPQDLLILLLLTTCLAIMVKFQCNLTGEGLGLWEGLFNMY